MANPVNVAIVGSGFGLQVHLPAFKQIPGCRVVALSGRTVDKLQAAAKANSIPSVHCNWRDLLESQQIDALSLAVPPALQAEIALSAAKAGKHLFCEKPLALNADQGSQILNAADKARTVHAMDFIFPELPSWQKARETLVSGELGKIRSVALTWRVETFTYRTGAQNWKTAASDGGGTLNNFFSHSLYYLEWLFGPINRLNSRLTPRTSETEARVDAWLQFEAGFPATISVAADSFLGPGHSVEVYGDAGTLVLQNTGTDYAKGFRLFKGLRSASKLEAVDCGPEDPAPDGRIRPVQHIAQRFISAIQEGGLVRPNLIDGQRVQVLTDALRLADKSGTWQDMRLL